MRWIAVIRSTVGHRDRHCRCCLASFSAFEPHGSQVSPMTFSSFRALLTLLRLIDDDSRSLGRMLRRYPRRPLTHTLRIINNLNRHTTPRINLPTARRHQASLLRRTSHLPQLSTEAWEETVNTITSINRQRRTGGWKKKRQGEWEKHLLQLMTLLLGTRRMETVRISGGYTFPGPADIRGVVWFCSFSTACWTPARPRRRESSRGRSCDLKRPTHLDAKSTRERVLDI